MALPTIFREYIGSKPYPPGLHDFPDIIDPRIKEFHFIIAFAAEKYDENSGRGTGNFYKKWFVPPIDGAMIRRLKHKYEHVKVVISIGGQGSNYPFNPADPETWPDTVSTSLIEIINDLNGRGGTNVIDGIDINYDTINSGDGDVDVFARCVGRLINILRNGPLVNVVSIAPSYSVQPPYSALYAACGNYIDWVNFKFYTHHIASADEFTRRYRQLANEVYPRHKLLAGFSTDPYDAGHLSREVFLDGCRVLINAGELPGIFVWNANDSYFPLEIEAQNLLTQH